MATDRDFEVIIIGAGSAGLSAALFTTREKLRTLVIERTTFGGQIANAETIENYPGLPEPIRGIDLAVNMLNQSKPHGLQVVFAEVEALQVDRRPLTVATSLGTYSGKVIILACGSSLKRLGVPGELAFEGRGVSYCATCDGGMFHEQSVAVVGGGDAALDEALYLTELVTKVTVIHRSDHLRAARLLQERAMAHPKIAWRWHTVVEGIEGNDQVERLRLKDVRTGETSLLPVAGVFIYVGLQPNTGFLQGVVPLDAGGHVLVNQRLETHISGLYAAGDLRQHSARQVIASAGDGATAACFAIRLLRAERAGAEATQGALSRP
jgi:thioredoxin reductase (NADPH)